jgi:hypothetical protein
MFRIRKEGAGGTLLPDAAMGNLEISDREIIFLKQDSFYPAEYSFCAKFSLFFYPSTKKKRTKISFNLNSFPGLHVMNILGNLACMVSTAFEVPGDHDIMRTA